MFQFGTSQQQSFGTTQQSFGLQPQQPPEQVEIDKFEKAFDTELKGEIFFALQDNNGKRLEPLQLQRYTISGYDALSQRLKDENTECTRIVDVLSKIKSIVDENNTKVGGEFESKLEEIEQTNILLSLKVLRVQKKLEVLMAQNKPNLSGKDLELQNRFLSLEQELQKPNQYRGKLNELLPKLQLQQKLISSMPSSISSLKDAPSTTNSAQSKIKEMFGDSITLEKLNINTSSQTTQDSFSVEQRQLLEQFMEQQTKGIQQLIDTLQDDIEDLQFIQSELSQNTSQ